MITRGFRGRLASFSNKLHTGDATTHHAYWPFFVADWFFYWIRPRTWPRVWPHLKAWLLVCAVWPARNYLRAVVSAELAKARPRHHGRPESRHESRPDISSSS